MQPIAAPATPAISGSGSIARSIALGMTIPNATLHSTRRGTTSANGIHPARVMNNSSNVVTDARVSPIFKG
jgi:hypothetical protein